MKYQKLAIYAIAVFTIMILIVIYALASQSMHDRNLSITDISAIPSAFNPDKGRTDIHYYIGSPGNANVVARIGSASGDTCRIIDGGIQGSGPHSVAWDGRDEDGDPVPDGVYTVTIFAAVEVAQQSASGPQNSSIVTARTIVIVDGSPPDIDIVAPGDGKTYSLGTKVSASWNASDDATGVRSASGTAGNGAYFDTATVGDKEFTVTATDNLGNTASKTVMYFVDEPSVTLEYQHAYVKISSGKGPVTYDAEIADSPEKIYKGLMYRTSLAADAGMLFVFSGDEDHYFWMKNTPIPLDLIYISSDFMVVGVREDVAPDSVDQITPPAPCKFILEVNAGQCRQYAIQAGDDVEISTE